MFRRKGKTFLALPGRRRFGLVRGRADTDQPLGCQGFQDGGVCPLDRIAHLRPGGPPLFPEIVQDIPLTHGIGTDGPGRILDDIAILFLPGGHVLSDHGPGTPCLGKILPDRFVQAGDTGNGQLRVRASVHEHGFAIFQETGKYIGQNTAGELGLSERQILQQGDVVPVQTVAGTCRPEDFSDAKFRFFDLGRPEQHPYPVSLAHGNDHGEPHMPERFGKIPGELVGQRGKGCAYDSYIPTA